MKKIAITMLMVFFLFHQQLFGQAPLIYDKMNQPSANVASLISMSEIPVTGYTGQPNVSIPLDNIELDYFGFPISMSANTSGFKAEVHPSWVGMGWNLNIGGAITRQVKSYPDELYNTSNVSWDIKNGLGFYYSYSALDNASWNITKDFNDRVPEFPTFTYNHIDRAPDIFSFSFLGYSGKFFLNHKGEWKVQSEHPIKVVFNAADLRTNYDLTTGIKPTFNVFTLIDEKGVKYTFGGTNAIEYSVSMKPPVYDYTNEWTSTSWYLKKIEAPNGEVILLNYERGPYQSTFTYNNQPTKVRKRASVGFSERAQDYIYNAMFSAYPYPDDIEGSAISGSVVSPVYLRSIQIPGKDMVIELHTSKSNELAYYETTYTDSFKEVPVADGYVPEEFISFTGTTTGIAHFDRNPDDRAKINASTFKDHFLWLKLDEIRFKYAGSLKRTIKFNYMENPGKRLRLLSFSNIYPGSTQEETYSFEYHPNLSYMNNRELEYLSEYGDQWGYSNLKYLWDKNVVSPQAPIRERAKFGVLSKVIYPTKGSTEFIYENHDYSHKIEYINNVSSELVNYTGDYLLAGGLRIRKIVNTDALGGFTTKEYLYTREYGNGEVSSGILRSFPVYLVGDNIYSSGGNHIGYSQVFEKYADGSFRVMRYSTEDETNSIIGYRAGVKDDLPVGGGQVWGGYIPHSDREFERGRLLDEFWCEASGRITRSRHNIYTNIGRTTDNFVRTVDPDWGRRFYGIGNPNMNIVNNGLASTAYYFYCYHHKLTSTMEVEYAPSSNVLYGYNVSPAGTGSYSKQSNFEYDLRGQMIAQTEQNSAGKLLKTTIKYPYTDNPASGILRNMLDANMIGFAVEQKSYVNTTFTGGEAYTYADFSDMILLSKIEDIYADNTRMLRFQNTKYNYGKLIERTYGDGLAESYLWDIDLRNLMAVIKNASINTLNSILPNGYTQYGILSTNYIAELNTLRNNLGAKSHIITYFYNQDNSLKQLTAVNGMNNHYEYDTHQRLRTVKDHNNNVTLGYAYNYGNGQMGGVYLNDEINLSKGKICPQGYASNPSYIYYYIPAGIVSSTISKADANNKARQQYNDEAQEIANDECDCVRSGNYDFEEIQSTYPSCEYLLASSGAYYYENELTITHIALTWMYVGSYEYPWYTGQGVIIGRLHGSFYPSASRTIDFTDQRQNKNNGYGNDWKVTIDTSGYIYIRLNNPDVDKIPEAGEMITFESLTTYLN